MGATPHSWALHDALTVVSRSVCIDRGPNGYPSGSNRTKHMALDGYDDAGHDAGLRHSAEVGLHDRLTRRRSIDAR